MLALLELAAPARRFPRLKLWRLEGAIYFAIYLAIVMLPTATVDRWLAPYQLFDLSELGLVAGTVVGVFAIQIVAYVWHRALHEVPFLWRTFHQMHHSAERVDIGQRFSEEDAQQGHPMYS